MDHENDDLRIFMEESGETSEAFMEMVMKALKASALDRKTGELAYIAVLAATRMTGGLPFHVKSAKALGATREEVKSAVLVGQPAVGFAVVEALPLALRSYDEE